VVLFDLLRVACDVFCAIHTYIHAYIHTYVRRVTGMWQVPLDVARSAPARGSRGGGVSRLDCPLGLGAIHRIQHSDKINWIAPVDMATMPGTLLVADTTEQLKLYTGLDR
jgi:hypothetical protein